MPELTGREESNQAFKLTMKAALIPLRLNELLGFALRFQSGIES
jgi:hypothetical protein